MSTTETTRSKSDARETAASKTAKKLLQLTELKAESSSLEAQFDSFWRSL